MSRPKSERGVILVGFELDRELLPMLLDKIKEAKMTKREYLQRLVLKDLGYKFIPRQVIPKQVIPARIIPLSEIESDEDSV